MKSPTDVYKATELLEKISHAALSLAQVKSAEDAPSILRTYPMGAKPTPAVLETLRAAVVVEYEAVIAQFKTQLADLGVAVTDFDLERHIARVHQTRNERAARSMAHEKAA